VGEREPFPEIGRPRLGFAKLGCRSQGKRKLLAPDGIGPPGKLRQELRKLEDALGMARDGAQWRNADEEALPSLTRLTSLRSGKI
jgi:hypothetical protein